MANQVRYYDTSAMRQAASDIRAKIKSYRSAHEEISSTVNTMNTYFDDNVNRNYVKRYNSDLKPTSEDIMKLMETYAQFLDDSADAYDKVVTEGNSKININ